MEGFTLALWVALISAGHHDSNHLQTGSEAGYKLQLIPGLRWRPRKVRMTHSRKKNLPAWGRIQWRSKRGSPVRLREQRASTCENCMETTELIKLLWKSLHYRYLVGLPPFQLNRGRFSWPCAAEFPFFQWWRIAQPI